MSSAIDSLGVVLTLDGTSVGEMGDWEGPGLTAEQHDVTNHGSSGGYEELLLGIMRWEEIKFPVNFVPGSAGHSKLLTMLTGRTSATAAITWPDGATTWTGSAFCTGFVPKAPVNGVFTADVTLKPTGAWTGLT